MKKREQISFLLKITISLVSFVCKLVFSRTCSFEKSSENKTVSMKGSRAHNCDVVLHIVKGSPLVASLIESTASQLDPPGNCLHVNNMHPSHMS